MKYSFAKGLKKGVVSVVIFAIGMLVASYPELAETTLVDFISSNLREVFGALTIGGLATMIVNYLKVKSY